MRHVIALFDAPFPARAALRALAGAGFAPGDLACAASPDVPGASAYAAVRLPAGEDALGRRLLSFGLEAADADTCAEGVSRRGAILVVATGPTLSADVARRILDSAAPPSLQVHRARWDGREGDGLTRYGWSDLPAPSG